MPSSSRLKPILILAGGKGTRLAAVNPDRPKPMIPVADHPFLYYIFKHYAEQGFSEFIVSTGHMAGVIEGYPWNQALPGLNIRFQRESKPLGTGGAVAEIFSREADLDACWVVNGDTLVTAPIPADPTALEAAMLALPQDCAPDAVPNLTTDGKKVISAGTSPLGTIGDPTFDSGIAYITRAAVSRNHRQPPYAFHELLEPSIHAGMVACLQQRGLCYDIGTPERLVRFERFISERGPS